MKTPSTGAGLAVVLLSLVATSAPLVPETRVGPARSETVAAVDTQVFTMASRSGARDAMLDHIDPQTVLGAAPRLRKGQVEVSSPKGTRVWSVSALSEHGLPVAAEKAYRRAAAQTAASDPGCRLPWTLLAGIGRIESDHGRYGGARLDTQGVSRPRIIGVALDGAGPVAAIPDTDHGKFDGDKVWDRAVGPMQFIPSTWAFAASDGDGDGRMSPHDLDDAAAAAASYLCSGGGDLSDPVTQAAAIYRYNQDDYYVALVQAFEVGYRTGDFEMPPPPAVEPAAKKHHKKRHTAEHDDVSPGRDRRRRGGAGPAQTPSTSTSSPAPSPAPKPSPKPSPSPAPEPPAPTPPTEVRGLFTSSPGGDYLLDGKLLDLGIVGNLTATAVGDFDQDGDSTETNGQELAGMEGQAVTMVVVPVAGGRLGILSINGVPLS